MQLIVIIIRRIPVFLLLLPVLAGAQDTLLRLPDVYQQAVQHYPQLKRKELLKQVTAVNIDNLGKAFLPQLSLGTQASYQSDVTSIQLTLPGVNITAPSKDQYKIMADLNQLVYDGGQVKEQKNIQRLSEAAEQQKLDVELYQIRERINQLFLGVLYLDEQLKQVDIIKADLNNGIKKTTAQVNNGVAFKSNLNVLNAELLKTDQRVIEMQATRKGLIQAIGLFINKTLPDNIQLEKPIITAAVPVNDIDRPELKLFSTEAQLLNGQYKLIAARNRPKASLFLQSGYGRPGLNMLKNSFDFFYMSGVRINWSLGGLYTKKNEQQLLNISKQLIGIQKETFLLNTGIALIQQQSEIDKIGQLIEKDEAIIALRIKVKEAARAQLDNAVITANDYLREVNAEDQARQSLIIHQLQLLQARINYQTISGKQ
jgi:outer membrane protein TolC